MANVGASLQRGSAGRAPSGAKGAEPPLGGQGGAKPPEGDKVFVFKTIIFNASAIVLHAITFRCCTSCFFCADVYVFAACL